jgi:NAD+ synthase
MGWRIRSPPLGGLVKWQVRELARYLEVPEVIINKPPQPGLWEGQTDEGEIGCRMRELDRFIYPDKGATRSKDKVETFTGPASISANSRPLEYSSNK